MSVMSVMSLHKHQKLTCQMDGPYMTVISVCLTFWALLGDDIRILTTNRPSDIGWGTLSCSDVEFFGVLNCVVRPG